MFLGSGLRVQGLGITIYFYPNHKILNRSLQSKTRKTKNGSNTSLKQNAGSVSWTNRVEAFRKLGGLLLLHVGECLSC